MPSHIMRCTEAERASTASSEFQAWINFTITSFNKNSIYVEIKKDLPSEAGKAQALSVYQFPPLLSSFLKGQKHHL